MAAKKRGLNKGLGALLAATNATDKSLQSASASQDGSGTDNLKGAELQELPVDLIQRGKYQPRRDMDPDAL